MLEPGVVPAAIRSVSPGQDRPGDHPAPQPDLACLTEARLGWFADEGEVVASEPLAESHHMHRDDGRKILLWSRTGWGDVDHVGSEDIRDLGRFVAATTRTPVGPLRVRRQLVMSHPAPNLRMVRSTAWLE